jgi:outer membrane biosynthesis protein TonB
MATATLPQIAAEAGLTEADHNAGTLTPQMSQLSMDHVAEVYDGIQDYAVEYAKAIHANPKVGLPIIQPNGQLAPSGQWPHSMPFDGGLIVKSEGEEVLENLQSGADDAGEVEVGEISEDGKEMLAEEVGGKKKAKTKKVGQSDVASELAASAQSTIEQAIEESASGDDVVFGVDDTEKEEEVVATSKKKTTKKKVAKKTATKKVTTKKASEVPEPQKKTVAKKATTKKAAAPKKAPASTKKATTKKAAAPKKAPAKANPPKAPKTKKPSSSWGPETFQARFNKDLNKPAIQELSWGETLTKEFQGEKHQVQITQEGWKYKGTLYPTLYTVMCKIKEPKEYPAQLTEEGSRPEGTRTMASMSALRFFGLEKRR